MSPLKMWLNSWAIDPLQLVAGQVSGCSRGVTRDDGVAGRVPGGEGVDPVLVLEQVDRWHRRARGDGHLLDDVQEPALVGVGSSAGASSRPPSSSATVWPPPASAAIL